MIKDIILKKLDLTGDRPLTYIDAVLLAKWWREYSLYDTKLIKVSKNRYQVLATKRW